MTLLGANLIPAHAALACDFLGSGPEPGVETAAVPALAIPLEFASLLETALPCGDRRPASTGGHGSERPLEESAEPVAEVSKSLHFFWPSEVPEVLPLADPPVPESAESRLSRSAVLKAGEPAGQPTEAAAAPQERSLPVLSDCSPPAAALPNTSEDSELVVAPVKEPAPSERENVLQPNGVSVSPPPVAPVGLAEGQFRQHPVDGLHEAGNISLRVSERGDKPLAGAELAFTAKIIERPVAASVQPEAPPVSKPIDANISAPPPGVVAPLGERFSPDASGPDTPDAAEPLRMPGKAPTRIEEESLPPASDAHRPRRANEGRVAALGSRNTEAPAPPTHAASVVRETGFVTTPRARPDAAANTRPSPAESGPVMQPDGITARQISVRVAESGRENVEVRLAERAGELHVAVRARDAELARSLGDRLSELVLRLEQKGFEAEAWRPLGAGSPVLAEPREARTLESGLQRGPAGEGNSGWTQDGGGDRQQHNRGRHEWIEALEASLPSGGDSPTQRGVTFDGSIR